MKSHNTLQATGAIHLTRRYKMQWDEENKHNPETANKHKKPRVSLPHGAVAMLKEFYDDHITKPYLTDAQKKELAEEANVTEA